MEIKVDRGWGDGYGTRTNPIEPRSLKIVTDSNDCAYPRTRSEFPANEATGKNGCWQTSFTAVTPSHCGRSGEATIVSAVPRYSLWRHHLVRRRLLILSDWRPWKISSFGPHYPVFPGLCLRRSVSSLFVVPADYCQPH